MTENIENLVLEHLRAIRAKQAEQDERLSRIESRLSSLEIVVSGMRRDLGHMYADVIEGRAWFDDLRRRVERIERRLDLSDTLT